MKKALTEEGIRTSVLTHAIKLGKCPPVGSVLSFNFHLDSLDTSSGETRRVLEKKRYSFKVSEQDIAIAQRFIEEERWTHGAKVTIIPLESEGR